MHSQSPMLRHHRRDFRQLDPARKRRRPLSEERCAGRRRSMSTGRDDDRPPYRDRRSSPGYGLRDHAWRRQAWIAPAAPCGPSREASTRYAKSFPDAAAAAPARSAPRGSTAQDRCDPSRQGISETQPAQGVGNYIRGAGYKVELGRPPVRMALRRACDDHGQHGATWRRERGEGRSYLRTKPPRNYRVLLKPYSADQVSAACVSFAPGTHEPDPDRGTQVSNDIRKGSA